MTPDQILVAGCQWADDLAARQELRVLRNLIGMIADDVPPDQIAAYLSWEREFLEQWPDQIASQIRAWLTAMLKT